MQRPKATPLPTSFPPEDFLRLQPPNRICYKCNKIPRTPLRPECCSTKLYCEPCSLKVKICSTHQAENKFKRDDELFTVIPHIKIKCPNWREGCDFKETTSKVYRKHLPECTKSKNGMWILLQIFAGYLSMEIGNRLVCSCGLLTRLCSTLIRFGAAVNRFRDALPWWYSPQLLIHASNPWQVTCKALYYTKPREEYVTPVC